MYNETYLAEPVLDENNIMEGSDQKKLPFILWQYMYVHVRLVVCDGEATQRGHPLK